MGQITNQVITKGFGSCLGDVVVKNIATVVGENGILSKMAKNALAKLESSSSNIPVVTDCRNIASGITEGNFKKVTKIAPYLALFATPAGGTSKLNTPIAIPFRTPEPLFGEIVAVSTAD